jgi:thiol:disulfide interchange protein DsbD
MILSLLTGQNSAVADADFLQPEQAFQFNSKKIAPDKIEVTFRIADGYYMYHERFRFEANNATLGKISIPKGTIKFDETFQKDLETFRKSVTIQIQLASVDKSKPTFTLITHSQGCSDQGLCYVPMESKQTFSTSDFSIGGTSSVNLDGGESSHLQDSLKSGSLLVITPLFLLLGLGLAFTPCVLPMVPILSSIIVGEGVGVKRSRALILSLSYSIGMAVVYTALGISAGLLGEGLAATLQNPWVLGTFGLVLVGLSLSMFNVYQLQLPVVLQSKLSHFSGQQRSGKLFGVFIMGAISALIVGPCVAAPLASALLYISQTRDVFVGGAALFSMAIGMSIPLILVGYSAGTFLPRAGRWMDSVKQLFGVLMLAMALWLVSPVLPAWIQMAGWAVLFIGYGLFLFRHTMIITKGLALGLCTLGLIEFAGVATGGRDVFAPFAHMSNAPQSHVEFVRINSIIELEKALEQAKLQGKPVMLDFYADWCVACKEMEKLTFTDERVMTKFAGMVLLQADVTANNDNDRALLKRFNLYGPPGMVFFGLDSKESGRVIGFQNADKFVNSLSSFVKLV